MPSSFHLSNGQGEECVITHPENAGPILISSDKIMSKSLLVGGNPKDNSDLSFILTSNTTLTIKVKGTDGVIRSANITLT